MKIRNGFVSNSSSSSFVIVGWSLPKEKYDEDKISQTLYPEINKADYNEDDYQDKISNLMSRDGLFFTNYTDGGALDEESVLLGYYVNYTDCDCWQCEDDMIKLSDIINKLNPIKEKLDIKEELSIITSTKVC